MSSSWIYDQTSHRYRSKDTGRYLSAAANRELRDDAVARERASTADLATLVGTGEMSVSAFEMAMREKVKAVNILQFALGRGGRNAITPTDRLALGKVVQGQYVYLRGFASDIVAGKLSAAQIGARANLYLNATTTSYERGQAASRDLELPVMPGEDSECRSNCACSWQIDEQEDAWSCVWTLSAVESCPTCLERAEQYNPLVIAKGG